VETTCVNAGEAGGLTKWLRNCWGDLLALLFVGLLVAAIGAKFIVTAREAFGPINPLASIMEVK
jgi:hypothetical protein